MLLQSGNWLNHSEYEMWINILTANPNQILMFLSACRSANINTEHFRFDPFCGCFTFDSSTFKVIYFVNFRVFSLLKANVAITNHKWGADAREKRGCIFFRSSKRKTFIHWFDRKKHKHIFDSNGARNAKEIKAKISWITNINMRSGIWNISIFSGY